MNVKNNHSTLIEKEETKFKEDIISAHGYSYIADVDMQLDGYKAAKEYYRKKMGLRYIMLLVVES